MKIKIEHKNSVTYYRPSDEADVLTLVLTQPSIINKSKKYAEHINTILTETQTEEWYFNILKKFKLTQDPDVVYNEFLDKAIEISDKFTKLKYEMFDSFADKKKKTDNSVFFEVEDIAQIFMINVLVKLLVPFTSSNLVEDNQDKLSKTSFTYIIETKGLQEIITKLHDLVHRKLFRCVGLDPTVMKTIQLRSTMSDHDFVLYLFDYIISAILAIYDMTRNPVTFIVTSVDQVMTWHFKGLYQKAIAYKPTGELFGKTMGTTNLPERIISDMIYDYVQDTVSKRNKEKGIDITEESYGKIDKYFYIFFIVPFFRKLFDIKDTDVEYGSFKLINIQLFLYYSLKDFMEKYPDVNMFPFLKDEAVIKDKRGYEDHKIFELLKRVPVTQETKYSLVKQTVFENGEFLIDDFTGNARNNHSLQYSGIYKIESLEEMLTSKFKFYGINNIMILNNYLKGIMNVVSGLTFKNMFVYDLTTVDFKARKYAKQLELELFPFLMVILENKFEWYDKYKQYVFDTYCSYKNN